MATNPLQPKDVCEIIEACKCAGMEEFAWGDLRLTFRKKEIIPTSYPVLPVEAAPNHVQQNKEALELDEDAIRAEQLRMLMIENPMEYERQLKDGELDEPGESDESE